MPQRRARRVKPPRYQVAKKRGVFPLRYDDPRRIPFGLGNSTGGGGTPTPPPLDYALPAIDAQGQRHYVEANDASGAIQAIGADGTQYTVDATGPPPSSVQMLDSTGAAIPTDHVIKGVQFPT